MPKAYVLCLPGARHLFPAAYEARRAAREVLADHPEIPSLAIEQVALPALTLRAVCALLSDGGEFLLGKTKPYATVTRRRVPARQPALA